jgi:hypothetical protein
MVSLVTIYTRSASAMLEGAPVTLHVASRLHTKDVADVSVVGYHMKTCEENFIFSRIDPICLVLIVRETQVEFCLRIAVQRNTA